MSQIPIRRLILLCALAVLLVIAATVGLHYYRYFSTHVSTDDAYVDGNIILVTPRVSGTVTAIYVMDNWQVKAGDLLVELDPRDFEVRVDEAQAQLERARQTVDQLFSQLSAAEAGVKLADSQLRQAQLDYRRAKELHASGVVSNEFFDQATTALNVARANQLLAEHEVQRAMAALGGDIEDHARYQRPIVQQAEAALEAAKLDLGYTRIRAPTAGIVTHKSVHVGHRVQVGQPLMALVPTHGLYITANFKETQLTDVRVGQKVDVEADIYPGHIYRGHVDSISMGTGSVFSLLPPENATGNWVKVVQRVPVKVVLDQPPPANKPLRLGLSVDVAIDLRDKRGPLLSSILQSQYRGNGGQPIPPEVMHIPAEPNEAPTERHQRFERFRRFLRRYEHRHRPAR
jgi:membrane fusion protein, multidrug efflux system